MRIEAVWRGVHLVLHALDDKGDRIASLEARPRAPAGDWPLGSLALYCGTLHVRRGSPEPGKGNRRRGVGSALLVAAAQALATPPAGLGIPGAAFGATAWMTGNPGRPGSRALWRSARLRRLAAEGGAVVGGGLIVADSLLDDAARAALESLRAIDAEASPEKNQG